MFGILLRRGVLHNLEHGFCSKRINFKLQKEDLEKMNHIANNLALAGKPINNDDLITLIMNGVGPMYEATENMAS